MKKKKQWLIIPIGLGAVVLVSAIAGNLVSHLWNWLMPELFGLPRVTFWQALGLLALCRILFGGLGRHGGKDKDDEFTPEQRERFRQRLRERFGFKKAEPGQVTGEVAP